ncbi:MAG: hypothetical protein ACTTKM_03715 [Prevotella fusca]|uniref:hypothetical protein n=1 Tax=Prevotella fusca TaxID=589436 RepID=UPI003FA16A1E
MNEETGIYLAGKTTSLSSLKSITDYITGREAKTIIKTKRHKQLTILIKTNHSAWILQNPALSISYIQTDNL